MYYNDELYHFGIKGQKWGVRRYQNKDGSYKSGAEGRYDGDGPKRTLKGNLHRLAASNYNLNARTYSKLGNKALASMNKAAANRSLKKAEAADLAVQKKRNEKLAAKENKRNEKLAAKEQKRLAAETKKNEKEAAKEQKEVSGIRLSDRQKKALKVGVAVGATVLAAYGAKKLYDHVDASHKGKLIAKKLLEDAGGDFEKASAAYDKRLNQYHWDRNTGALGKYAEKSGKIMEATRKSIADSYRKNAFENSQINKDLRAIKDASRARRKEQFDRATKGVREAAGKVGNRARSGADAARSRAGEAAKNARSAYERNAGKRMANSINRSYARKQAVGKAKKVAVNAASRARSAAKSGASRAQEYVYNKSMERTRNKYAERVARDLRRRGRL